MNYAEFAGPGYYRIAVQGRIDATLCRRLGAMRVVGPAPVDGQPVAILEGSVSDQAELSGILNALYEFHYPLLSVNRLVDGPPSTCGVKA